jgi:ATP-dependent DNA helicase DinG
MFVLLSAATPTRLLDGFPPGVRVSGVPRDEAIRRDRARLAQDGAPVHDASLEVEEARIDDVE